MKKVFTIVILLVYIVVWGQKVSSITNRAHHIENFIPNGWKQIAIAKGDLNNDKSEDVAIVIQNTDTENIIANTSGLGPDKLNLNPRHLILLLNGNNGYWLKTINKVFIPTVNDTADTCHNDPFIINDFSIKDGKLIVTFEDTNMCSIFAMRQTVFTFSQHNNTFILSEYSETGVHSASGSVSKIFINFLKGEKKTETGGNEFIKKEDRPVSKRSTLKIKKMLTLDELGCADGILFD